MPIFWRNRFTSVSALKMFSPSNEITPEDGSSSRLQQRKSVLLPEPEGPMRKSISFRESSRSTPLRISTLPKDLRRPSM